MKLHILIIVVCLAGCAVSPQQTRYIQELESIFPNIPSDTFSKYEIEKDEVENLYFISPRARYSHLQSEAYFYIGVTQKNQWLRMRIKYRGLDWLFARSYKISADDYKWSSPPLDFKRDFSSSGVWEWIDVTPSKQDIENMKALAMAANAVIRFRGQQYYSDFKLSADQQKAIEGVLELYDLMKAGR